MATDGGGGQGVLGVRVVAGGHVATDQVEGVVTRDTDPRAGARSGRPATVEVPGAADRQDRGTHLAATRRIDQVQSVVAVVLGATADQGDRRARTVRTGGAARVGVY